MNIESFKLNTNNNNNKKNKKQIKIDFSEFDTTTGEKEKKANSNQENYYTNKRLELMEAMADSKRDKDKPYDMFEIARDGTIGTGAGFAIGNLMGIGTKAKGALSLGLGALLAGFGAKKHKAEYNKEMAAREFLAGKRTAREEAYRQYLKQKYGV